MFHIYICSRAREVKQSETKKNGIKNMHESWKNKQKKILLLIKYISDQCGGDDIEWLREYEKHIVITNKDCLDKAIRCFECLCSSYKKSFVAEPIKGFKTNVCKQCGYVEPFCYFYTDGICLNI
jgi:hypothetical protein